MEETEPKLLYRRLDKLLFSIDPLRQVRAALVDFLSELFRQLHSDLRLAGAVLFDERPHGFERRSVIGATVTKVAEVVPRSSPWLRHLLQHRSYIYADPAATDSPHLAGALPPAPTAAIVVGDPGTRHVLAFLLEPDFQWEKVDFTLNTIRVALGARLFQERIQGTYLQAVDIQRSLLVDEPPDFPGYDIACRSEAADVVGGDFYDFIPFESEVLGVSIGDASGHGLPAALLVRDVVTGLRMGLEKDLKVGYVFRKLNRVIHRSRLSSRFVSLFYGELEPNGNLIYINGGHEPPLLFLADRTVRLTTGGTVIGPLQEAHFKRGFAHVDRGATLLLLTDGLIERADPAGEHIGHERLKELVRSHPKDSARELLDRIFEAVIAWGGRAPWEDDATAVVIRRDPTPPALIDLAARPAAGA